MTLNLELIALIASLVSVIISIFAIWLSTTFYRWSNDISDETREAAKSIDSGVARLESLFDRMYTDTFSMMKDTVSDMRRHMWPENEVSAEAFSEIEERADEKIQELRSQISSEMSTVMRQVGRTDTKLTGVEERLAELIDQAIQQTRLVESEAQEEISMSTLINSILDSLERYGPMKSRQLLSRKAVGGSYPVSMVYDSLNFLERKGLIEINGDLNNPNTKIRMSSRAVVEQG